MKNFSHFYYNKYNFYHNEWYFNVYNFNKYINVNGIIFNNYIYNLLNFYFNKTYNNKIYNIINKIQNLYNVQDKNYYNKSSLTLNNNLKKYVNKIFFDIVEIKYFTNKLVIHVYIYNREKYFILKKLKYLKLDNIYKYKSINNLYLYMENKLLIINNKLYLYNYYSTRLFINNFNFNTYSILKLKKILSKLFNKRILFNLTNLKYFHLNKNIMLDILSGKINNNRKQSVLRVIRKSLRFAKVTKLHYLLKIKNLKNLIKNNINFVINDKILYLKENWEIIKEIFKKGANLHTIGFKLESKGRLTKRLVAARTIKKTKNKGGLNSVYSSINRNSTILFKGFEKSNIDYTNKNHDNLLGCYGIKYWISSY
jgi:hypothetical protein